MKLEEIKPSSFVYRLAGALPVDFCNDVVARFEASPEEQYAGRVGQNEKRHADIKNTVDLRISGKPQWRDVDSALFSSLREGLSLVCAEHPFFASNRFKDIGYNLQRYEEGGYYHWHVDSGPGEFSQRQLVAIWYLNDVPGPGGETEFAFQEISIRPVAGELVLFPPFWTHVHRAVPVESGRKYIATTWVCFS
jgi:Rps23 Pro-64 3,4-dihydroxylase Tpa1-like proline 4-hydroxylase